MTYGRDRILQWTKDALLYSQLLKVLSHTLKEAPALLGAADHQSLCLTAEDEEHQQAAMQIR